MIRIIEFILHYLKPPEYFPFHHCYSLILLDIHRLHLQTLQYLYEAVMSVLQQECDEIEGVTVFEHRLWIVQELSKDILYVLLIGKR